MPSLGLGESSRLRRRSAVAYRVCGAMCGALGWCGRRPQDALFRVRDDGGCRGAVSPSEIEIPSPVCVADVAQPKRLASRFRGFEDS